MHKMYRITNLIPVIYINIEDCQICVKVYLQFTVCLKPVWISFHFFIHQTKLLHSGFTLVERVQKIIINNNNKFTLPED